MTTRRRISQYHIQAIYVLSIMRFKFKNHGFMPMTELLMHVNKLRVYPAYKDNFNKSMKLLARRGVIELDKNINTSRISARLTNQGLALAREIYAQLSGEQIMNEGNYPCGVNNCGDGHCVHQWYPARCPECGSQMVLVATSKFMFCSNRKDGKCEFECFEDEFKDRCALINTN